MTKVEAIEVLHACKSVYERAFTILKYQPTPQEQECLAKFIRLYESDLIDDEALLKEAGIDVNVFAWLVGYSSPTKKPFV